MVFDRVDPRVEEVGKGGRLGFEMGQWLLVLIGLLSMLVSLLCIFLFLTCLRRCRWRPHRFFLNRSSPSPSSRIHSSKVDDLETPLFSDEPEHAQGQINDSARNLLIEGLHFQSGGDVSSPGRQGILDKRTTFPTSSCLQQGGNFVLEVVPDALESVQVAQTLKYSRKPIGLHDDDIKHARMKSPSKKNVRTSVDHDVEKLSDEDRYHVSEDTAYKRSHLNLEVISGPAVGLHCSHDSSNNSRLQVNLGRVPPNDLILKDSEVSGKHAVITWNMNRSRWELVDMGSLNGTFLNSQAIHHPDSACRQWSDPVEIASGDIITLGTSSRVLVNLATSSVHPSPFGIGMASEPMAMRRGGKKLPMEDVSYSQWPLPGLDQFGLFGIFDGHGGAGAANASSKMLPKVINRILLNPENRAQVLSLCDASRILRDAFLETEAAIDYQYEGCTATILLVWSSCDDRLFAQCANVGDSACFMNVEGQLISMTQDHRFTSPPEQARLRESGRPLKDGESRFCGINLARMLGDKFLKEHDSCFTAEPFVSEVVCIDRRTAAFALMASDGLWDVITSKRAVQLILKEKEKDGTHGCNADCIANTLLKEARALRTKDNTSVIFLDFESRKMDYSTNSVI